MKLPATRKVDCCRNCSKCISIVDEDYSYEYGCNPVLFCCADGEPPKIVKEFFNNYERSQDGLNTDAWTINERTTEVLDWLGLLSENPCTSYLFDSERYRDVQESEVCDSYERRQLC